MYQVYQLLATILLLLDLDLSLVLMKDEISFSSPLCKLLSIRSCIDFLRRRSRTIAGDGSDDEDDDVAFFFFFLSVSSFSLPAVFLFLPPKKVAANRPARAALIDSIPLLAINSFDSRKEASGGGGGGEIGRSMPSKLPLLVSDIVFL